MQISKWTGRPLMHTSVIPIMGALIRRRILFGAVDSMAPFISIRIRIFLAITTFTSIRRILTQMSRWVLENTLSLTSWVATRSGSQALRID